MRPRITALRTPGGPVDFQYRALLPGSELPGIVAQGVNFGVRKIQTVATEQQTLHMCVPQAGTTVDDSDGLEQTIAKLKGTFAEPIGIKRLTVYKNRINHRKPIPLAPGCTVSR